LKLIIIGLLVFWLTVPTVLLASEYYPDPDENTLHPTTYEEQQEALSQTLRDRATAQTEKWYGACVIGVRQFLGVGRDEVSGMAKNLQVNSERPAVGAIIKLNMSWYGHVGAVIDYNIEKIVYYDTNGDWTGHGAIREIGINDKRILGFKIP